MVDLEEVRKYLTTALGKFRSHEEYEDGFQEGMIRAWKDIEDGNDNFLHVAHRAKQWASNYIVDSSKNRRRATGTPANSKDGRNSVQGEKTRSKITQYITEYKDLHGVEPTNVQISQGTGLSSAVVSNQRRNIRAGNFNHAQMFTDVDGSKRVDYSSYKSYPITDENEDAVFSTVTISFENELVGELHFLELLKGVEEKHRTLLYQYYILDWNTVDMANHFGVHRSSISVRLKNAHEAVLAALDPEKYGKRCRNNKHLITNKNTVVKDGSNVCLDCRKAKAKRQNAKEYRKEYQKARRKPKVVSTHCGRGHEIRGFKSDRRYCKICNYLSQHPGRTVDDIRPDSKLWQWDVR